MSGSQALSEEERREMVRDAMDAERGKSFLAARLKSQQGGLDEYIDFLSENAELMESVPAKRTTSNFKL